MTDREKNIRADVRGMKADYVTLVGYVRGLLGRDGSGGELAAWALDEQKIMRQEKVW